MAYTTKTQSQIKSNIIINLVANVDAINDLNVGSILDVYTESIAQEISEIYDDLDVVYNGTRITTATATDLENIGAIVGVTRNAGEQSTGTVSLIRANPADVDFTITQGTVLSTQPNIGETVYNYTVDSDTIFKASISDETNTFINGIYEYKFSQRLVSSINTLSGTGGPFTNDTDYSIEEYENIIIDAETYVLLDDCEVTTGWTASGEAGAIATSTNSYQATKSLALIKTGTADTDFVYSKTLGSAVDISETNAQYLSVFIEATNLAKLESMKIYLASSDNINISFEIDVDLTELSGDAWERILLDITDSTVTTINGAPDTENIDLLRIECNTINNTDTITGENFLMDFWFGADYINYKGNILQWDKDQTIPTTTTTVTYSYVPLSVDVEVTAQDIGEDYNVGAGKIIYKVTNISQINSVYNYEGTTAGIDLEVDDSYRTRILTASDLANKATASAIEANVESLSFVKTASVDDLPERTETTEPNVYDAGVGKYLLKQKIPIDNVSLVITGTLSATPAHTFIRTTDYILNTDGYIEFGQGGDDPDDGTITYTTYNYNKLGHFDALVAGVLGNLTTLQIDGIETVIDNTKSVGITHDLDQPTYTEVPVTVTPTINSDYDAVTVKEEVSDNITTYIRSLNIGDDVLVSKVIDVVMDVEGVTNIPTTLVIIDGVTTTDKAIASTEIAIPGLITIS